jgi:hypothetical protein
VRTAAEGLLCGLVDRAPDTACAALASCVLDELPAQLLGPTGLFASIQREGRETEAMVECAAYWESVLLCMGLSVMPLGYHLKSASASGNSPYQYRTWQSWFSQVLVPVMQQVALLLQQPVPIAGPGGDGSVDGVGCASLLGARILWLLGIWIYQVGLSSIY